MIESTLFRAINDLLLLNFFFVAFGGMALLVCCRHRCCCCLVSVLCLFCSSTLLRILYGVYSKFHTKLSFQFIVSGKRKKKRDTHFLGSSTAVPSAPPPPPPLAALVHQFNFGIIFNQSNFWLGKCLSK